MSEDARESGDLTVIDAGQRGFVIYRVLKRNGSPLGWQLVGSALEFPAAINLAKRLAEERNVRAWLEAEDGTCQPLT